MEVSAGTSDAAVIDSLMAAAMVGEGTGYEKLTYTASFNSEEYGVGFRKGSDMADKLNDFFAESYKDGSMRLHLLNSNIIMQGCRDVTSAAAFAMQREK